MLENSRAHFSKSLFWYWSSWSVYHQESFSKRDCSNHENCNIKFPLNTFSNQITICQISFEIYTSFTSNSSSKQIQFGCLPFLFSFFSWKTINKQGIIDKIRPEIHIVRRNIVELETWLRQEAATTGVLWKRCSWKFCKIHRKAPLPESFFKWSCRAQPLFLLRKSFKRLEVGEAISIQETSN